MNKDKQVGAARRLLVPFHAADPASLLERLKRLGLFRGKARMMGMALSLSAVLVLAAASLVLARDVAPTPALLNAPGTANDLNPEATGLYRVKNKWAFLYLTGSLPGTLSNAEWQWRSGVGAANYWWMDASATDLYLFSKSGWARNWNPEKSVGPYNYLGMVVSISEFQEWFWCGIPLYNRYRRFLGYGCHPEYGPLPEGEGQLTPWMLSHIEESQPHVWTVLGVMCILKRSEHMEVQPPCPDSNDSIRVLLSGQYGNSCPELNYTVFTDGPNIEIEGTVTSGDDLCPSVVTSWTIEHELGVLPGGTYTITATIMDQVSGYWGFQDTLTFDVAEVEIESGGE